SEPPEHGDDHLDHRPARLRHARVARERLGRQHLQVPASPHAKRDRADQPGLRALNQTPGHIARRASEEEHMKGIYILAVTAAVIGCGGSSKPPLFTKPAGTIVLGFSVDDSNNKVFADKDMEWKGSMIYDATTNKATFAGDWNGGNGPYAPLYDDGPLSQGGHEPEGSKAGDHI